MLLLHHLEAVHNGLPLLEHASHAGQQVMPRCKHCLLLLLRQAHGSLQRLTCVMFWGGCL